MSQVQGWKYYECVLCRTLTRDARWAHEKPYCPTCFGQRGEPCPKCGDSICNCQVEPVSEPPPEWTRADQFSKDWDRAFDPTLGPGDEETGTE